MPLVGLEPT